MACHSKQEQGLDYPNTRKVDTVDSYFGQQIADPYRWLENDTSTETTQWVNAQNQVTFDYLETIPYRDQLKERLTQIWNYARYSTPFKRGEAYFFFKNNGLQNQDVLFYQKDSDSEVEMLLDPNTLSEDGTVALASQEVSNDGKYLAYALATGGSDWREIKVMDIASRQILNDHVKWVKFSSIAWYKDGFFYSCYDPPKDGSELSNINEYHKVYYHKIGTAQSEDQLIYENKTQPKRNFYSQVTEDERYLIIYETESTSGNSLYIKDLNQNNAAIKQLAEGFDYDYSVIGHLEGKLYVITNRDAPRWQLLSIDLATDQWETVLPEKKDVLSSSRLVANKIIAHYMKDAHSILEVYGLNGQKDHEIKLPTLGTVEDINTQINDSSFFYSFESFTVPPSAYHYTLSTRKNEIYKTPKIDFDFSPYQTKQIFYTSKDGTKVPMFIIHKKGLKPDGNNPTMLYGYGGFNISLTPWFSISRLLWLENGGVFAIANIRGGGEYGKEWHKAGTKLKKQNVFDDFIAAAEYLIAEKYTSPNKLGIMGGSNGGLLVGAVSNQRPELFQVAIPMVGVMDMLRYHHFTIGWAWAGDYGTSDSAEDFKNLLSYSPLHNIKEDVDYPAIMVMTADHDDRVVPAHSFKYTATLQEKYKGDKPVIIRIETMAGHGAGTPTKKLIAEAADIYAFAFYNMGIELK